MEFLPLAELFQSATGGVVAGVAFWVTVKVELKYHRRDIDLAHKRITDHVRGHGQ